MVFGLPLSYVTDIFEGDLSLGEVGASSIVIGLLDGGCGLPVFILTLLLALKYRGASLFRFSLGLGGVLRAASTVTTSLSRISALFSFGFLSLGLPVEGSVSADFWLPVEAVFSLPVETGGTDLAGLADGVFLFGLGEAAFEVPIVTWACSVLPTLLCNLFSLGVKVDFSPFSSAAFSSCFPFWSFFGVLAVGSWPLSFFSCAC